MAMTELLCGFRVAANSTTVAPCRHREPEADGTVIWRTRPRETRNRALHRSCRSWPQACDAAHFWRPPTEFVADSFGIGMAPLGSSVVELEKVAVERAQEIAQQGYELARHLGFAVESRSEPAAEGRHPLI